MSGHKCTEVDLKVLTMLDKEVGVEEEDFGEREILGEEMLQILSCLWVQRWN